jgi:glycerol-3-phosphate acyltransferase PlsY
MDALVVAGALLGAYAVGAIPFSYLVARAASGEDLRRVRGGTVSGSAVGESAGFWAMAVAGLLDIGKGAAAVILWSGSRPGLAALAAGSAAVGHNWSIFLRGAGGRAISVAGGSLAVLAWEGVVVLGLGLALGKLAGYTSVGSFVSQVLLPIALWVFRGPTGALLGLLLVVPMWLKRVLGNAPPADRRARVYLYRLLRDHDPAWG